MVDTLQVPRSRFMSAGQERNFPSRQLYFMKKPAGGAPAGPDTIDYKTGSFTLRSGTGSQSVTGVGFTPKALILFSAANTGSEDTIPTQFSANMGFSDGTTEKSISSTSEDALSSVSDAYRYANSDKIFTILFVTSGAVGAEADLTSFDADGFTLDWTTNTINGQHIKYIAIGGDAVTGVDIGSFLSSASMGVQNISTGIANADFVMVLGGAPVSGQEDTTINGQQAMVGMATGTSNQGVSVVTSEDAVATSDTYRYQRTNQIAVVKSTATATIVSQGAFDGFTSSGFDINWNLASPFVYYYLTIKGGQWEVGNGTTPASTTPQTKPYTTTFEPKGLGLFGKNNTASSSVETSALLAIGAADGTNNMGISVLDLDGVTTTDTARRSSSTECYAPLGNSAGTSEQASLDSFNATDFTLDFSKTIAAAREFIWFVCGDNSA